MNDERETENSEGFFSGNESEAISSIMSIIVAQQNIALDLTKLILEHCVEGVISKEEVFEIFDEACDLLKEQNGRESESF